MSQKDDSLLTMRRYLVETYRIADRNTNPNEYVNTAAVAEALDVSAPAVNRMVVRLREQGWMQHEPYQGIRLTEKGRHEALQELRRYRITETFLQRVMGFGWEAVYEEAQTMRNGLTDAVVERMAQMTQQPTFCPHGEPIPNADGQIAALDDQPLAGAPIAQDYVITRVRTRERERLEYMAALGLLPHSKIHLLHAAPFNGPMQLKINKEFRIIGHNLAELIRVQVAE
jgi:DtxR family transcriptional regulator, Mn-dependent transcriptional regulator